MVPADDIMRVFLGANLHIINPRAFFDFCVFQKISQAYEALTSKRGRSGESRGGDGGRTTAGMSEQQWTQFTDPNKARSSTFQYTHMCCPNKVRYPSQSRLGTIARPYMAAYVR